jgi:hypothetical protein
MTDKDLDKEIEKGVEKELAKREFLNDIRRSSIEAISTGNLNAKDIIAILSTFTVQGYIVAYGYSSKGKEFFKTAMENSWTDSVDEYMEAKKEAGIDEDDQGKTIVGRTLLQKIITEMLRK